MLHFKAYEQNKKKEMFFEYKPFPFDICLGPVKRKKKKKKETQDEHCNACFHWKYYVCWAEFRNSYQLLLQANKSNTN